MFCTECHNSLVLPFVVPDVHMEELNQPASVNIQPSQSLTIQCRVSYDISSYNTGWIRQASGGPLEWVGLVNTAGTLYYKDSLKNKFTLSRDTSSKTLTLQGQNLQAEDTAVYYCARRAQWLNAMARLYKNTSSFTTWALVKDMRQYSRKNISSLRVVYCILLFTFLWMFYTWDPFLRLRQKSFQSSGHIATYSVFSKHNSCVAYNNQTSVYEDYNGVQCIQLE